MAFDSNIHALRAALEQLEAFQAALDETELTEYERERADRELRDLESTLSYNLRQAEKAQLKAFS